MAMSVLFNWSCCSGLSQTGSLSPPLDISAFPGLTQLLTIPGAASQDTLSFGSFSYTSASLPQEMSLDSETWPGCTCIWSLPGHERCLKGIISRRGQPVGLHSQTLSPQHSGLALNLLTFLPLGVLSLELSLFNFFFFYTPFYFHCYYPQLFIPAHSDPCNGLLTTPGLAFQTILYPSAFLICLKLRSNHFSPLLKNLQLSVNLNSSSLACLSSNSML